MFTEIHHLSCYFYRSFKKIFGVIILTNLINIYCDESCHLENDDSNVMVLGSIWCPETEKKQIYKDIRGIKIKHGLKSDFEIKWTKVSPAKVEFYLEIINYFFKHKKLKFRAVLIPDKSILKHSDFNNTHDDFYYRMYYHTLKHFLNLNYQYKVYIDIKDTKSWEKTSKLKDYLNNYIRREDYYISGDIIQDIQLVRSHEVELIQLADLLIGAICYKNRGLPIESTAKQQIVGRIIQQSNNPLNKSSLYGDTKFNLLKWKSKENCF